MQKNSRPQFGLEEEILIMIHKLIEKKTSKIFKQPVDGKIFLDYYEKIKKPIDISTMVTKLKSKQYQYPSQILDDFNLMMANCRQYNMQLQILRTAEKFERSIETEWSNFKKQLKKKEIDCNTPLNINEDVIKRLQAIQDKNNNRRPSTLQINLIQSERKTTAEFKFLPPLPSELFQCDKNQNDLPKQFAYHPQKYSIIRSAQKIQLCTLRATREQIAKSFDELALKKIQKYKKILQKKILWIDEKIIKKCLERKRFRKMMTPIHLTSYIESGEIASNLQLRKIQMYVKMVAYWIQQYPQILSYVMKNKFIDTCRAIKKCVFRVLRYKKVPRSTKIHLDLNYNDASQLQQQITQKIERQSHSLEINQQLIAEQQTKRYDNEIKSFKRMLSKDQGETIKKYTKIMIKNENGQFTVIDWNMENNQKKQKNRSLNITRAQQNTEQVLRVQKEKQKKEERQRDEQFLAIYKAKNNLDIISVHRDRMVISWDFIKLKKLPSIIQFNFTNKEIC